MINLCMDILIYLIELLYNNRDLFISRIIYYQVN